MNLKFHMQHDQAPKLQNSKIELGREFKMAPLPKIAKLLKSPFSPERFDIFA